MKRRVLALVLLVTCASPITADEQESPATKILQRYLDLEDPMPETNPTFANACRRERLATSKPTEFEVIVAGHPPAAHSMDTTRTDRGGNYRLGSPLNVVTYIGVDGRRAEDPMPQLTPGRSRVGYTLREDNGRLRAMRVAQPAPDPDAEPGAAKLAIMVLEYPDQRKVVHLPNDHGYLIKWDDVEPPAFYLYNRPAGRITRTLDFTEFLAGLKELPTGVKVDRIRGCAGGFSWAMPRAERQQVQAVLEEKRFRLTDEADGNFVICTCETKDVTLLEAPTPSSQPRLTAGKPENAWESKVAATGEVIPVPGEESIPLQTSPWGPERSGLQSRVTTWSEVEQGMLLRAALELRCVPDRLPDGVTHLNTYLYEEFLELSLKNTETGESFAIRPYDPTRGLLPSDVGESVASLDGRPLALWRADFPLVRLRGSLEPGVYQGVVAYSFPEERTKLWDPKKDWESFGFWHGTVTSGPFQIRVLRETPKTKQLLLPLRLRYSRHERKVYYTKEDATPVEVPVRNGCFLGTQVVGRGREMLRGGVIRPDDANGIDNSVDIPKNGEVSYTIEVFETSDPPCHLWDPHLSGDHGVL